MAPIPKMSEPICLIMNTGDKPLSVNEEAKKILENISQPLVVVSIVGPYRSGKSYLLNKLSGVSGGGFSLGHTVCANTKGIWMRCLPHPNKPNHTLILLDTEGVGDPEKASPENDSMILSLAMLMSSAVIYNSMGTINQDAVKKLYSMTERHQFITEKASKQDGQTGDEDHMSSHLVWTVRDATLKLEINGGPVTPDEYLENSLKDIKLLKSLKTQEQNKARKRIRIFFPKRKCFVFDYPSSDIKILRKMDQVLDTNLQPKFVEETKEFCQYILEEVPPKRLREGMAITGSRFSHLLQSYVDVVRRQDIVFLENSLSGMFVTENRNVIKKCIEVYESKMSCQHVKSHEDFQKIHDASVEEAMQTFNQFYVKHEKSQEEYGAELKDDLQKKKDEIWKLCEDSSLQKCNSIVEQLKSKLEQNLKENKYHVPGGLKTFISDKNRIIQEYNQIQDKGVKAEDVLQAYLSSLEPIENIISQIGQEEVPAPKPKIFKVTDPSDTSQLTKYIQDYQLPPGPFNRILIQLFGFAGHGKSSFVNSCLFVSSGRFQDHAGEGTDQGGKTIDRRGYQLTNSITIVDNRGLFKMDSNEEWEIYAQLCNCVPLNEIVSWNKSREERVKLVTSRIMVQTSELIVPVLVYSSHQTLSDDDYGNIKEFLKQAQQLTRILPFVVLTNSKSMKESPLKDKFSQMGMENIYHVENYTSSDHISLRGKHLNILSVLYDILDCVNFHMSCTSNFQGQRHEWITFLMNKAGLM